MGRTIYFDLIEVCYQDSGFVYKLIFENLTQKQLNLEQFIYLAVVVRKVVKQGLLKKDKLSWQLVLIRLPTRQLRIFMGLDQYQDFDFEWSYLQEVLKDIHQFSFKGYSQDL